MTTDETRASEAKHGAMATDDNVIPLIGFGYDNYPVEQQQEYIRWTNDRRKEIQQRKDRANECNSKAFLRRQHNERVLAEYKIKERS